MGESVLRCGPRCLLGQRAILINKLGSWAKGVLKGRAIRLVSVGRYLDSSLSKGCPLADVPSKPHGLGPPKGKQENRLACTLNTGSGNQLPVGVIPQVRQKGYGETAETGREAS